MNSIEIERKKYWDIIIELRKESKNNQQAQKSDVNPNSGFGLSNIKLQQESEDRYAQEQNFLHLQQQISQLSQQTQQTENNEQNYYDKVEKAQNLLKDIYAIKFNISKDALEQMIYAFENVQFNQIYEQSKENCQCLTFNKNNTLLATANGKNIKLWRLENKNLFYSQTLQHHKSDITSILFCKETNSIISGGYDNDFQICIWGQGLQKNNEWGLIANKDSKSPITCMTLNQKENLLIVGNKYGFVQIWSLNFDERKIDIKDEQRKIHTKAINGVSLNKSETQLVTCSLDKKIIIWKINNGKIVQEKEYERENQICSILFLDDRRIIFSESLKGLFELSLDNYQNQEKLLLEIKEEDKPDFPIQYNENKQAIIIKQNNRVYFFRDFNEGNYEKKAQLELQSEIKCGTLSDNGQFLIIGIEQKIKLFEIIC